MVRTTKIVCEHTQFTKIHQNTSYENIIEVHKHEEKVADPGFGGRLGVMF